MWRAGVALLFLASAGGTIYLCAEMRGGMQMPGGWTMSMAWMRMPGESWFVAAASFMAMWTAMMVAMMLPSLMSTLSRNSERRLTVGAGYFLVWAILGAAVYPLGIILTTSEMRWSALARAVPMATGAVFVLAGCVQLTPWKARLLGRCREASGCGRSAWRHGLRLGMNCILCCVSFMTILLVTGVMNLTAMAIVTTAITIERLVPSPQRAARAIGVIVIAAGILSIWSAVPRHRFHGRSLLRPALKLRQAAALQMLSLGVRPRS